MLDVDYFVMDFWPFSKTLGGEWLERGTINSAAAAWLKHIQSDCLSAGVRLNIRRLSNQKFESGLDFTRRARVDAFRLAGTELFVLSDNDMLPFSSACVIGGLSEIEKREQYGILSAWPDPHSLQSPVVDGRVFEHDDSVLEHYACGGLRFCRKLTLGDNAPEIDGDGYDRLFCRWLFSEHGKRVGYLKKSRAFHLGTYCTSLWGKQPDV